MCLYGKYIQNRKYVKNKKNGGVIPPVRDERHKLVPVGCGECMECRKKKAREWQIRLTEEVKRSEEKGIFVTLTFSNESINKIIKQCELGNLTGYTLDNAIAKCATRLFLERWRKKYGKSVRHWLVTELGHNGTENIHMHGIIWVRDTIDGKKELERIWQYGYCWMGKGDNKENYVNAKTVNYIMKYITKMDLEHKKYKPKILSSPGIGEKYMESMNIKNNTYMKTGTDETYRTSTGHKVALPIYYRNKIYTEEQRENLWTEKLNKGERWICGEMVKEENGKDLYELLQWYRRINERLGYGDGEKDWEREEYERQRRILLYETRLAKARERKA